MLVVVSYLWEFLCFVYYDILSFSRFHTEEGALWDFQPPAPVSYIQHYGLCI